MPWRADLRLIRGERQEGDERAVREILLDLGQAVGGRALDDPAGDAVAEPLVDQRAEGQRVGLLGPGGGGQAPAAAGTGAAPAAVAVAGREARGDPRPARHAEDALVRDRRPALRAGHGRVRRAG